MDNNKVSSLIYNLGLCAAIYLGIWEEITWIAWLVSAFVWIMLIAYSSAIMGQPTATLKTKDLGSWFWTILMDVGCTFSFIYNDWYVTGSAYLVSALMLMWRYRSIAQ